MELLNDTLTVFEDPVCNSPNTALKNNTDNLQASDNKVMFGLCPYCANYTRCNWKMDKKIYCEHYE